MRRDVPLEIDGVFHVYNRGTNKMKIFNNEADYVRFQHLLYVCNQRASIHLGNIRKNKENKSDIYLMERGKPLVQVLAYCLMPNHFHLVLRPLVEGGASHFLRKICTGYSMYFNKLNERSGTLFQGKFRSKYIADDLYLKQIFSYIHLNPAELTAPNWKEKNPIPKQKIMRALSTYSYSSYRDFFARHRPEGNILTREANSLWTDEFKKPEQLFDFYEVIQDHV